MNSEEENDEQYAARCCSVDVTQPGYYCDYIRHLVCVPFSKENLHRMAADLGIKRCWFDGDHYDIPKLQIDRINNDPRVKEVSPQLIIKIMVYSGETFGKIVWLREQAEKRKKTEGWISVFASTPDAYPDPYHGIVITDHVFRVELSDGQLFHSKWNVFGWQIERSTNKKVRRWEPIKSPIA